MKYKVIITTILFIISFILIKLGSIFIKDNDGLMKILKEKQFIYNKDAINAVITNNTMIPGISGKKINLNKSYNNMKRINEFKESLLVYDEIKPNKSIKNIFDKVIISGNQTINKVSILTTLSNNYCFTENIKINNNCHNKQTVLIKKITNNYLSNIKEYLRNGIIFYLEINDDKLNIITKYVKSNNYEIVSLDNLLKE